MKNRNRFLQSKGYVMIRMPEHPRAHCGYVLEHIPIAEKKIGRKLRSNECVHHINHDKQDNRPSNLSVLTRVEHGHLHSGFKIIRKCLFCNSNTTNKAYCSAKCSHSKIKWPTNHKLLKMAAKMSMRDISRVLGVISHVSVFNRLKFIRGPITVLDTTVNRAGKPIVGSTPTHGEL